MFCHNCGKQIPDNTKFCHYCGAAQNKPEPQKAPESQKASASAPPPSKSGKTPIWIRLLLIFVAVLIGRGVGQLMAKSWNSSSEDSGSTSNNTYSQGYSSPYYSSSNTGGGTAYTPGSTGMTYSTDSGTLGDYYVTILSAETGVSYTGKTLLIVAFNFTNNSSRTSTFSGAIRVKAYQDEETLFLGMLSSRDNDPDLYSKVEGPEKTRSMEVAPGESLVAHMVFNLNNTTSDVLIEAAPTLRTDWGAEEQVLRKTFTF